MLFSAGFGSYGKAKREAGGKHGTLLCLPTWGKRKSVGCARGAGCPVTRERGDDCLGWRRVLCACLADVVTKESEDRMENVKVTWRELRIRNEQLERELRWFRMGTGIALVGVLVYALIARMA